MTFTHWEAYGFGRGLALLRSSYGSRTARVEILTCHWWEWREPAPALVLVA